MYENHNDYSFIIIQIVPFLYMFRKISASSAFRLMLGAALVSCVVGILMSLSRGGMLALLLELGLIILMGMDGRKRFLWLPILAIVGLAAVGYQWSKRTENQGAGYTAADAEKSRYELWRIANNLIHDKPLLGVGSLRFSEYASSYGEISHDNRGKNTHNTFLEILTGTGLIGFTAFFIMIFKLIRSLHSPSWSHGPPVIESMRRATLIALYSILFRAVLDAKPHDWSFYVLLSIGLSCVMLQRKVDADARAKIHSFA
jgi:O-antigen ligase